MVTVFMAEIYVERVYSCEDELVNDSHTDNDYRKVETRPPDVAVITTVQVSAFLCHLFRRTINLS